MKRFTASEKWDDHWFRKLPPVQKCFWQFICDRCDAAGVWKVDLEALEFYIGCKLNEKELLESFEGRIRDIGRGKWWIVKFIAFQCGRLSRECKPHLPIFKLLVDHGISLDDVEQNEVRQGGTGVPPYIRAKVIARDGLVCAYTGEKIPIEDVWIDHVIPKASGGTDSMLNLVVASRWANSLKGCKNVASFCKGAGLDFEIVFNRLHERLGEGLSKGSLTLQEKETYKEKEGEGESAERGDAPTLEQVQAVASMRCITPECAEAFWNKHEGRGWVDGQRCPVRDWKPLLQNWAASWRANDDRSRVNGHGHAKPNGGLPAWRRLQAVQENIKGLEDEFKATSDEGKRTAIREEIQTLRAEKQELEAKGVTAGK